MRARTARRCTGSVTSRALAILEDHPQVKPAGPEDFDTEFLSLVRQRSGARILYYGHDLHHERLLMQHQLLGSGTVRREAEKMRRLELSLWRDVDAVYVARPHS